MHTPSTHSHPVRAWRDNLTLVQQLLPFTRRAVRAGDAIYDGGAAFSHLYLVNSGQFKTVNVTADGRGQVQGTGIGADKDRGLAHDRGQLTQAGLGGQRRVPRRSGHNLQGPAPLLIAGPND